NRHDPTARQPLTLSDGPRLENVKKTKQEKRPQREQPGFFMEKVTREGKYVVFFDIKQNPPGEAHGHCRDFVEHHRTGIFPAQFFFRDTTEPDRQENSSEQSN